MPFGDTAKKLQKVTNRAEDTYKKVNELVRQLQELRERAQETTEQVEDIQHELDEQRAIVEALAREQGLDVDEIIAEQRSAEGESDRSAESADS